MSISRHPPPFTAPPVPRAGCAAAPFQQPGGGHSLGRITDGRHAFRGMAAMPSRKGMTHVTSRFVGDRFMITVFCQQVRCQKSTKNEIPSDHATVGRRGRVPAPAPHSLAPPVTEVNGTGTKAVKFRGRSPARAQPHTPRRDGGPRHRERTPFNERHWLMSCRIHMSTKNPARSRRAPRPGAESQPAPGPHSHHAPLKTIATDDAYRQPAASSERRLRSRGTPT